MEESSSNLDLLFSAAESLSRDFSLFPRTEVDAVLKGVLSDRQLKRRLEILERMEVDAYIEAVVQPVEDKSRPGARAIIRGLNCPILSEVEDGPFYAALVEMDFGGIPRRIGFITQDRKFNNGAWLPQHHELASKMAIEYATQSCPIVTFMDTPGAVAGEEANSNNQAHSISRLIAELCNIDVPNIGIIIGQGYSGGAIPLAASNILLSLRTAVFSTIHPKGLASINQRYNLSWQECAKFVGISPPELYKNGIINGVVDYEPGDEKSIGNLRAAIVTGVTSIENKARDFINEHPEILTHYQRNINRYLNLSETMQAVNASSSLKLRHFPTEYPNIFGVTYRYMRYLGLRKRIKSTTTRRYGRLSVVQLPKGQMAERANRDRRTVFLNWLQDPEKVIYDDVLSKSWRNYTDKKAAIGEARGRIAQFIFGEPLQNFRKAKADLCLNYGLHLYNHWKGGAQDNLAGVVNYLGDYSDTRWLIRAGELQDVPGLLKAMAGKNGEFIEALKSRFSYEGLKLFDADHVAQKSPGVVTRTLITEFNLLIEGPSLVSMLSATDQMLSAGTQELIEAGDVDSNRIQINRRILEDTLWSHVDRCALRQDEVDEIERTILDVILDEDIRGDFIVQCQNLLMFGLLYDSLLDNLGTIARQAHDKKTLNKEFIRQQLDGVFKQCVGQEIFEGIEILELRKQFSHWIDRFVSSSSGAGFLKSVEEWKRIVLPEKSDTLFVIISFILEKLIPEFYHSEAGNRKYEGKVVPIRIGRRKDFWNRLTIAYRDLLFQEIQSEEKKRKRTSVKSIQDRFFTDFEELYGDLMTADPVSFPTLRPSVEGALEKGIVPCGTITGIGTFKADGESAVRVGAVISNLDFQVGCMDLAGCEKICKLLVDCARHRLPVICFISSGGMQTKEGGAALFSMAVLNDRFTRFIRDNDLPIIVFGFGDCTGGAQASFVTHPLVQTYYFSGTDMPFAGQKVVESNLPSTCTLSNYLSSRAGAMKGLVKHPFAEGLDQKLRKVDPAIPLPTETVEEVVSRILGGSLAAEPALVESEEVARAPVMDVRRVLIHARGCTAVKLVGKAREAGLEIVLVQSDPDMDSVAADMVNEYAKGLVVCIGGNTSDESYLNALSVLRIAEDQKVDSLHPGIGFLSEDSKFARLCRYHGINFIGPLVLSMETMGNKSNAISTAMRLEVPVVPGSHGIVNTSARAAEVANLIGYPILIKAVHGGGGKGIKVVERPEQIHSLFHQVTVEARNAFGNGDIYLEKYVTSLRHIEVQILRDTHGHTKILGLRDCSVQRNNQKLMEESDSTILTQEHRQSVFDYARKIADRVDYHGAGTVEFIYDVPSASVFFMEMNTRLQVEHPVTEAVTGVDIVRAQFDIASGRSIEAMQVNVDGYALEVRVNAERAVAGPDGQIRFHPTPGAITQCVLPQQSDIELISMAAEGKIVSPFYDSLIIQIIAKGRDRNDTIAKMLNYLERVKIHGICTNISLIKRILADKTFIDGDYDTEYLPTFLDRIDTRELIRDIEESSGIIEQPLDLAALAIEGSDEIKVVSPSTAVFYLTPSPSEPEYVSTGDVIGTDQVLCQLEAMKMFTPISLSSFSGEAGELYPSDKKYQVQRINVANGQQVNEGDLLFVIKPQAGQKNVNPRKLMPEK